MHWKGLNSKKRDTVIMGDANLCALKWGEDTYQHKDLADLVQDYLLETSSFQLVTETTRSGAVAGGEVSMACLDHCYSDVPEKISEVKVVAAGNSDHLAVIIKKLARYPVAKPQTLRKRMYKNFDIKTFLQDVNNSNINKLVTGTETLDAAAEIFEEKFRSILDYHAPMKTVQIRKNYSAFISEETKDLISVRKVLQEEVSKTGNPVLLKEFRYKCKEVKREVKTDEKKYFEANFSEEAGVTNAWRTANEILGTTKNLAPTVIKHQEENEKPVLVTSPKKIATIFNNFFRNKVEKLRNKTNKPPSILPTERLKNWLKKRLEPPPSFKIKKVDKVILRKAIKRMKGKRGHGVDTIDSYSLKLASPLIEDSLLHLVNLSIANNTFATPWKPQLIFPLHKKKRKKQS